MSDDAVATLRIRVVTRAGRAEVSGMRAGAFVVRVTEPPADGRANRAVCRIVAATTGVAPSRVAIVRGVTAREKTVRVEGVSQADAERAMTGAGV